MASEILGGHRPPEKIELVAASIRPIAQASIASADRELYERTRRLPDEALVVAGALLPANTERLARLLRCRRYPIPVDLPGSAGEAPHIGNAIAASRPSRFMG